MHTSCVLLLLYGLSGLGGGARRVGPMWIIEVVTRGCREHQVNLANVS